MDGGRETIAVLEALEAQDLLDLRVCLHSWVDPSDDEDALADIVARRDLAGPRWSAAAVKFMLDGVIDTGTAWLEEPDTHGDGTDPMWPDVEHFRRTLRRFHDAGFRIATHAIGDRAVREVLDAYATFPACRRAGTASSTSRPRRPRPSPGSPPRGWRRRCSRSTCAGSTRR